MIIYVDLRVKSILFGVSFDVGSLLEGMVAARAWCSGFAVISGVTPVIEQVTARKARNRGYIDAHSTHELQSLFMPKEGERNGTDTD